MISNQQFKILTPGKIIGTLDEQPMKHWHRHGHRARWYR